MLTFLTVMVTVAGLAVPLAVGNRSTVDIHGSCFHNITVSSLPDNCIIWGLVCNISITKTQFSLVSSDSLVALLNLNFLTWRTPIFKVPKIFPHTLSPTQIEPKSPQDLKLILILTKKKMCTYFSFTLPVCALIWLTPIWLPWAQIAQPTSNNLKSKPRLVWPLVMSHTNMSSKKVCVQPRVMLSAKFTTIIQTSKPHWLEKVQCVHIQPMRKCGCSWRVGCADMQPRVNFMDRQEGTCIISALIWSSLELTIGRHASLAFDHCVLSLQTEDTSTDEQEKPFRFELVLDKHRKLWLNAKFSALHVGLRITGLLVCFGKISRESFQLFMLKAQTIENCSPGWKQISDPITLNVKSFLYFIVKEKAQLPTVGKPDHLFTLVPSRRVRVVYIYGVKKKVNDTTAFIWVTARAKPRNKQQMKSWTTKSRESSTDWQHYETNVAYLEPPHRWWHLLNFQPNLDFVTSIVAVGVTWFLSFKCMLSRMNAQPNAGTWKHSPFSGKNNNDIFASLLQALLRQIWTTIGRWSMQMPVHMTTESKQLAPMLAHLSAMLTQTVEVMLSILYCFRWLEKIALFKGAQFLGDVNRVT